MAVVPFTNMARDVGGMLGEGLTYYPSKLLEGMAAPQQALFGALSEGSEGASKGFKGEQTYDFEDVRKANPTIDSIVKGLALPAGPSTTYSVPEPQMGGADFVAETLLDPANAVGGGAAVRAKKLVDKASDKLGGRLLEYVATTPDNLLEGFYDSPIKKGKALFNFAVDAAESAMKSMDPKAVETFLDTGYNPVLINKLNNFVELRDARKAEASRLESLGPSIAKTHGVDSPQYKNHKNKLGDAVVAASSANKRVEAQVQHAAYVALRAGVKAEDMPPLFTAMIDKMSLNGSGAQALDFKSYFNTVKDSKPSVAGYKRKIPLDKDVANTMFDKVLTNWGVKDPKDYTMIVRQSDNENPLTKDMQPIATALRPMFANNTFDSVDELYSTIKNKQKTLAFRDRGIGLVKGGEKGAEGTLTIGGRTYAVDDVGLRKGDNGVFMSIKGHPKLSASEIKSFVREKNVEVELFNKKLAKDNAERKAKGLGPRLDSNKKPTQPKKRTSLQEVQKIVKKTWGNSAGVKSGSFLEGGINLEVHIDTKGRMTAIVSDDYNFLENLMPSIEDAFETKILGVTPPTRFDLTKAAGDTKQPTPTTALEGGKRLNPKTRDEMIREQQGLVGGEQIPEQLRTGMLGAGVMGTNAVNQINKDEEN
jgi:hypothetical protein